MVVTITCDQLITGDMLQTRSTYSLILTNLRRYSFSFTKPLIQNTNNDHKVSVLTEILDYVWNLGKGIPSQSCHHNCLEIDSFCFYFVNGSNYFGIFWLPTNVYHLSLPLQSPYTMQINIQPRTLHVCQDSTASASIRYSETEWFTMEMIRYIKHHQNSAKEKTVHNDCFN